jgi:hypothetical protein
MKTVVASCSSSVANSWQSFQARTTEKFGRGEKKLNFFDGMMTQMQMVILFTI